MKILNAQQVRSVDQFTIKNEPIASVDLMERAATKCFKWITKNYDISTSFTLFCGVGNNGGDGLAIARMLSKNNYPTTCFIVLFSENKSADFCINEERLLKTNCQISYIKSAEDIPELNSETIVIDAIFGTGLTRLIEGVSAKVIQEINFSKKTIIAIDIPSGLFCEDNSNNTSETIIKANHTLSFEMVKLAFLLPESGKYCGDWHILPIGLNQEIIQNADSNYFLITQLMITRMLKQRNKFSHKGTYGHALLIAGSEGKMGAAVLATSACLRSGAGLVTSYIPQCGINILQTAVPEAMAIENIGKDCLQGNFEPAPEYTIGIGPGIGTNPETASFLENVLKKLTAPLVIDADAINSIAKHPNLLSLVPKNSIFTPHPKEFSRLVGDFNSDMEKLEKLQGFVKKSECYVVLKGAHTAIACPDGSIYFNTTGNSGMATGGSGDVLTGILTGLLAQGYSSKNAAILGVYLHGLAGDIAIKEIGKEALIASDLIKNIGKAWKKL